jgi:sensor histidine kinase YesM
MIDSVAPAPSSSWVSALARGLHARPMTLLLIAAINTAIALVLWTEDPRPIWHPLLTVHIYGFCVAYCVNVAAPWDKRSPVVHLAIAVAAGALIGVVLVILVKGYSLDHVVERRMVFAGNLVAAYICGLMISLLFFVKFRETRAAAALHRAEAERNLLAKQAVEAQLKLMQAQVEPHFLFNTLASVQFLIETDPPQASRLLGNLVAYLRVALPELRAQSSTLGREFELIQAYLAILGTRMGPRLRYTIDLPSDLAAHPFPPNMLISLVENAIKHGLEPSAQGGTLAIAAHRSADRIEVVVTDTGRGLGAAGNERTAGQGVGLANVRERLAALFGPRARFAIESTAPHGTRAIIGVPFEAA